MKMKPFDRVLLALYALVGLIGAAVLAWLAINKDYVFELLKWDMQQYSMTITIGLSLLAVILVVWSVKIITIAFKREPRVEKQSVSVQNTEDGSVRISVAAMDAMIKQAIGQQKGVMDVKSEIINHEDSISVRVEMSVANDAHIPNVTMILQKAIKNFVEEYAGIAVRDVSVLVTSIVEIVPPQLVLEGGRREANREPVESVVIPEDDPEPETLTGDLHEVADFYGSVPAQEETPVAEPASETAEAAEPVEEYAQEEKAEFE